MADPDLQRRRLTPGRGARAYVARFDRRGSASRERPRKLTGQSRHDEQDRRHRPHGQGIGCRPHRHLGRPARAARALDDVEMQTYGRCSRTRRSATGYRCLPDRRCRARPCPLPLEDGGRARAALAVFRQKEAGGGTIEEGASAGGLRVLRPHRREACIRATPDPFRQDRFICARRDSSDPHPFARQSGPGGASRRLATASTSSVSLQGFRMCRSNGGSPSRPR